MLDASKGGSVAMWLPERIRAMADELTAIRRDLHAHPELGFEEVRTSGIVAEQLRALGIRVTTGIGRTGVVGILDGNRPGRTIGLRADMDALPIEERSNLPYRSRKPGVFHGCGHDGHTTILLGAARYLAETRNFDGTVYLISNGRANHAGKGVGTAMYEYALVRMKDAGMRAATVGTGGDPSHAPARRAYAKVGFTAQIPSVWMCRLL
jgi:metal-dependent amidase/aminoacylase/carboxypeptidase family protein